jgi:hypothetical protein
VNFKNPRWVLDCHLWARAEGSSVPVPPRGGVGTRGQDSLLKLMIFNRPIQYIHVDNRRQLRFSAKMWICLHIHIKCWLSAANMFSNLSF